MKKRFPRNRRPVSQALKKMGFMFRLLTLFRKINKGADMGQIKEEILRIIRHGLTVLAGVFATKDVFAGFEWEPVISAIMAIVAYFMSRNNSTKLKNG